MNNLEKWLVPAKQDPADVLDYPFQWADFLAGDTITSSAWTTSPTGLVTSQPSTLDDTTTVVWLSGGTAGTTYTVTNRITTTGGRTAERSIRITITNL